MELMMVELGRLKQLNWCSTLCQDPCVLDLPMMVELLRLPGTNTIKLFTPVNTNNGLNRDSKNPSIS